MRQKSSFRKFLPPTAGLASIAGLLAFIGVAAGASLATAPASAQSTDSTAAATVATGSSTEVPEIVERSTVFHGIEAWHHATVRFAIESKSGRFSVVSVRDGDRFDDTVEDQTKQGKRRVRVTNDQVEVWLEGVAQPADPEGEQRLRDFVSARLYFPFLPFRLKDPGVRFQDLGIEAWGDRSLHKIKVTFKAGSSTDSDDEYLYWFDPQQGRLEQLAYSFHTGKGGLRFRRGFDHRRVGEILFFDAENWGVDGAETNVDLITEAFVQERMKRVSTVKLLDLEVVSLAPPKPRS